MKSPVTSNTIARVVIAALISTALLSAGCASPLDEQGDATAINLGTPADSAGLLSQQLDGITLEGGRQVIAYPLKDCCTTKTEYALTVDLLDAALLCPDAARRLAQRDSRYVVVGPVLVNSDVLVERTDAPVNTVVVGNNREYQSRLARRAWGADVEVRTALSSVVPFALVDGEVDAAVIDYLDARSLDASRSSVASLGEDVVSYELVVTQGFADSPDYSAFLDAVSDAADELNDPTSLSDAIRIKTGAALSDEEVDEWTDSRMRFVRPSR